MLELHPPRFRVLRLFAARVPKPPQYVSLSSKDTVRVLCKRLADTFPDHIHLPSRIWLVDDSDPEGADYPTHELAKHATKILEESEQTIEEALLDTGAVFVVEFKIRSEWMIDSSKVLGKRSVIANASITPAPLFSSENDFFSRLGRSPSSPSTSKIHLPSESSDLTSRFPATSPFSRSFALGPSNSLIRVQDPGTIGLGNMYVLGFAVVPDIDYLLGAILVS
jgi:ubiquitin carboxyl-terminal hydrolase 4/11/15